MMIYYGWEKQQEAERGNSTEAKTQDMGKIANVKYTTSVYRLLN